MKIVVTGSLGHIGKPLTEALVREGHSVIVISQNPERQKDIVAMGAKAAVGKLEDAEFLTSTFTGADAAYCMMPISFKETDLVAYFKKMANSYALAVRRSGMKHVVLLSGWVAGVISSYEEIENIFDELPDVAVTHIRPGYFYSNFFDSMTMIKENGLIAATFGGDDRIVFSAPSDIADTIANEITCQHHGTSELIAMRKVHYVASDEMTCNEAAGILGAAIGKPGMKWISVPAEQMQKNLESAGLSPKLASDLVEMQSPIRDGLMPLEFARQRSEVATGKFRLADFAREFSSVYNRR